MEGKPNIVEYLIITKQEDSFCDSADSFVKFLSVDSSLEISEEKKTLTITKAKNKGKFVVYYSLLSDIVPAKQERYFKLILSSDDEGNLNDFTELTIRLEKIIQKLHSEVSINVLWNDIARQYAIKGYTLINEVENLLRRLIASFMFMKVGYYWPKDHVPSEVVSRDEKQKTKSNYTNYLHETYFSDLKTILFKGQRDAKFRDIGDVQRYIERNISEGKKEISIDDLSGVVSKSLWEKYFSQGVNVKKEILESDLENLNNLRNEIAHNRHISRETLGKIETLSKKIIKALNLAIEELPQKILTPDEQKFQVNTELERIGSGTPSDVTESVSNYYNRTYQDSTIVTYFNLDDKSPYDLSIEVNDNIKIAVKVKYFKLLTVNFIENYIADLNTNSFHTNPYLSEFNQFHLIFVFPIPIVPPVYEYILSMSKHLPFYSMESNIVFGHVHDGLFLRIT